ncbi:hypothetical protein [Thermaerobacillus caldiproteolyticus]|uniref:hypothetical protein n=1 Tax=Thermaerobacillus caldiproteolyticus TaxID=247480 RepID=UPI0018F145FD|nr:hypothetical protein [Anoxybacillus caldiproteolyticus]
MNIEQAEEIFNDYGYASLFQHIRYPLMISEAFNDVAPDVLSHFLDVYSFETAEVLSFEEFIYHLLIFKKIYMNNELPFV